ncbi:MAG TPA: M17 family peptidase N-terminal domain-containing protein, partial [Thermomicrobiales bacterium]|nr:M17 family peptidase N-terminal domain-containing protein [Thermomicrobiales bacterium]
MEIEARTGSAAEASCDALIVPVAGRAGVDILGGLASEIDPGVRQALSDLVAPAQFAGKPGTVLLLTTLGRLPARRIVLAGVGEADALSEDGIARGFGAAVQKAREAGAREVVAVVPPALDADPARALTSAAIGTRLALYAFANYHGSARQAEDGAKAIDRIVFVGDDLDPAAIARGEAIAEAINLARDLVNEPASTLTPAAFAERAREGADREGLEIEVLDERALAELGANAILAVGGGSVHPPRLIRLRYRPEAVAPIAGR